LLQWHTYCGTCRYDPPRLMLRYVAVCCSVLYMLQCCCSDVAVCCIVLQSVVVLLQWHTYHGTCVDTILSFSLCSVLHALHCVAVCCGVIALCCSVLQCVLQCVAVLLQWHTYHGIHVDTIFFVSCCSVLQCVAVCCSVLQCVVALAHIPWHTCRSDPLRLCLNNAATG